MTQDRPLVAVVDDEEAVRKALGRLLQSAGLAVEAFGGGAEFLASLEAQRPDCVVLDLHMPDVTGFDVLARLSERRIALPVVVITGHDSSDAQESAFRGGARAYLRKPFNDHLLLDSISAAIASSGAQPPRRP